MINADRLVPVIPIDPPPLYIGAEPDCLFRCRTMTIAAPVRSATVFNG